VCGASDVPKAEKLLSDTLLKEPGFIEDEKA
jgi:hypothetical protein